MKPAGLMSLGVWCGLVSLFAAFTLSAEGVLIVFLGFGGGMLFGKGYGIWEERNKEV